MPDLPGYFSTLCCSTWSIWLFQQSVLLCLIYLVISVLCAPVSSSTWLFQYSVPLFACSTWLFQYSLLLCLIYLDISVLCTPCLIYLIISILCAVLPNLPGYFSAPYCCAWSTYLFQYSVLLCLIYLVELVAVILFYVFRFAFTIKWFYKLWFFILCISSMFFSVSTNVRLKLIEPSAREVEGQQFL